MNIPVGDTDTHLEFTITNDAHYYSGLIYPPAIGTSQIMTRLFFVRTLVYSILCISALTLALFFHGLMDCPLKKGTLSPLWFFLCLAFAVQCSHQFVWQLGLSSALWYAVEDTARLFLLAECAAIGVLTADLDRLRIYRYFARPLTLLACSFFVLSVLCSLYLSVRLRSIYMDILLTATNLSCGGYWLLWLGSACPYKKTGRTSLS